MSQESCLHISYDMLRQVKLQECLRVSVTENLISL